MRGAPYNINPMVETPQVNINNKHSRKVINTRSEAKDKNVTKADIQGLQDILKNGLIEITSSIKELSSSIANNITNNINYLAFSLRKEIRDGNKIINEKLDKLIESNSIKVSSDSKEIQSLLNAMEKGNRGKGNREKGNRKKGKEEIINLSSQDLISHRKTNNIYPHNKNEKGTTKKGFKTLQITQKKDESLKDSIDDLVKQIPKSIKTKKMPSFTKVEKIKKK